MLGGDSDSDGLDIDHLDLSFPKVKSGRGAAPDAESGRDRDGQRGAKRARIEGAGKGDAASAVAARNAGIDPKKKQKGGFQALGLSKHVFGGIMRLGYKVPTPIQRKALPLALAGNDVVAMARTGSGKTAAFLIPVLERLQRHSVRVGVRSIILAPTREIALQTIRFLRSMSKFTDLRVCVLVGGSSMADQFVSLSNNPDIIVATPGRLMHHLVEVAGFNLSLVEMVVFDEADRLFEMGFAEQLKEILKKVPEHRQTLLFSATMPKILAEFARAGLRDPEVVRLDVENKISDQLKLSFFTIRSEEKAAALVWVLQEFLPRKQQAMVFAATRHHVEFIHSLLKHNGIPSVPVYGSMDMSARTGSLTLFRTRKVRVLVATDVAARGIDVPLLDNVINYNYPTKPKLFVHRVGRVARQGRTGLAISLVQPRDLPYMIDTHLFLGLTLSNEFKDAPTKGYNIEEMQPSWVHYGCFSPSTLAHERESIRSMIDATHELKAMERVCDNALKQYKKTVADASKRSVSRARELSLDRVHPLLIPFGTSADSASIDLLSAIRDFRPRQTILEATAARTGSRVGSAGAEVMRKKRAAHETNIRAHSFAAEVAAMSGGDLGAAADAAAASAAHGDAPVAAGPSDSELDSSDSGSDSDSDGDSDSDSSRGGDDGDGPHSNDPRRSGTTNTPLPVAKPSIVDSLVARKRTRRQRKTSKPRGVSKEAQRAKQRERDQALYISVAPSERATDEGLSMRTRNAEGESGVGAVARLEDAVLDLAGEDMQANNRKKQMYHWDKRKKRYVKGTVAELAQRKLLKTESGAWIKIDKSKAGKMYEKWSQQSKRSMAATGSMEEGSSRNNKSEIHVGGRGTGRYASRQLGASAGGDGLDAAAVNRGKDELKSADAIRKQKKLQNWKQAAGKKLSVAQKAALRKKGDDAKFGKGSRSARRIAMHSAPSRSKMIIRTGGGGRGGKRNRRR